VEKETELLNVIRYVALNAVDAGIVERPEDDRWGSYRAQGLIGVRPAFRTDLFGVTFPPDLTPEGFAMRSVDGCC
jgi:hypothetical protein